MSGRAPVIFGVIGHVDHGKTSLVRALTNMETDRHPEEKKRGMSIDLGVASLKLPSGDLVGVIDLPGHSDFIRNMIAGISSVDHVLLVIAANEGVMPQTREHLEIASLMGVQTITIVFTKIELVTEEELRQKEIETFELLARYDVNAGSGLRVSAHENLGLDTLLAELQKRADGIQPSRPQAAYKMWVRDAFTMKGHGTVVRGVPYTGNVQIGDELKLHPGGKILKVRGIQSYRESLQSSGVGQSVALNLADSEPGMFERGMVITKNGVYREHNFFLIAFKEREPGTAQKLRVQVHCGTARMPGTLRNLGPVYEEYRLCQLKLGRPAVIVPGEKILLRDYQAEKNIGAGIVIAGIPAPVRAKEIATEERYANSLEQAVNMHPTEAGALIALPAIFTREELFLNLGGDSTEALALGEDSFITRTRLPEVFRSFEKYISRFHAKNPSQLGMKIQDFSKKFDLTISLVPRLLDLAPEDCGITIEGDIVKAKSFQRKLNDRNSQTRDLILALVTQSGIATIARGDLRQKIPVAEKEFQDALKGLLNDGLVVSLGNNLITSSDFEKARATLQKIFAEKQTLDLASYRDSLQVSRTVAVTLLEKFDGLGITKRVGSSRVLLKRNV